MIRVGFLVLYDVRGWTGGVNYLYNLFRALHTLPRSDIEPVLLTGTSLNPDLEQRFPGERIIRTGLLESSGVRGFMRRAGMRVLARQIGLGSMLRRHGIDVLSHSGDPGEGLGVPAIGWIADFQHLHVPEFFSPQERADRDVVIRQVIGRCERVIVSSKHAAADLATFAPMQAHKVRVMRFVATPQDSMRLPGLAALQAQYGFSGPYFHLPNQFWAHKNHQIVIDALARIALHRRPPLVLATGSPIDYRNPGHHDRLMQGVRELGLEQSFRSLGLVPVDHLGALMRYSVAVINPSLFEGWSTTVEEAKSIGKSVVLSDIAVHREQAPQRAVYFPPRDADALAARLIETLHHFDERRERQCESEALEYWPKRLADFGAAYQSVVREVAGESRMNAG